MTQTIPQTTSDYDHTRIIGRPDGFYWQERTSQREFGPFETLLDAVQDMQLSEESLYEPGETLGEAEDEIGIDDWIDPDTGDPVEEFRAHTQDDH